MADQTLVGFAGRMGAGKTAAAAAVAGGGHAVRCSFAEPLRRVLAALTGVPPELTRTAAHKARRIPGWDMTVGQALQKLGTDAIRNHFHADAWVIAALGEYDRAVGSRDGLPQVWVFDDVRFPNEVQAILDRGGRVFRVVRPDAPPAAETRDPGHPSETALDATALPVIVNAGSLDAFTAAVRTAVLS